MTGGTGAGHGRGLFDHMTIQESAANTVGLADVTITAGGMAGGTVVTKGLV